MMKWIQFFTPVKSIDFKETENIIAAHPAEDVTILDVRQPKEYKSGHVPGAVLIPLPELGDRLAELDPEKPALVYCAVGGRSRVAAQMLSGKGFKEVYNVSGGIKAWQAKTAVGPQTLGLDLFSGKESPEDILTVAYSLEQGLEEFYLTMADKAENRAVKDMFTKLSDIEVKHRQSILDALNGIREQAVSHEEFEAMVDRKAMEGGMTTEQYLELFGPDLSSETDVVSLAMSIEAQALDLYQRIAFTVKNEDARAIIRQIANEEKTHLASLGSLLDSL